jgi:DNA-binding response OmpR family regulator
MLVASARRPPAEVPPALDLLPHKVTSVSGADRVLSTHTNVDLAVVDGRINPAEARITCQLIARSTRIRVLLLVQTANLPALDAKWAVDDFIVDGATAAEWDSRIRLLLETNQSATAISIGPIVIDEDAYTVTVGGRPLDLTYIEFELLRYLVQHTGRVFSRETLLTDVWGYDYFGGTRTVDVHIRRLRAKLGPELEHYIATVRNVGYRLSPDHRSQSQTAVGAA